MFSFLENKKKSLVEDASGRNLHMVGGDDDDSFATRRSRTIGFFDEPAPAATDTAVPINNDDEGEGDYSAMHSQSFLDAVNFDSDGDDDDYVNFTTSGGLSKEEVESMTNSEREARFKVAEFAELTDSQREDRMSFLNQSLMAADGEEPGLGNSQNNTDGNQTTKGLLLDHPKQQQQHNKNNLMMEEGITMNLLDAIDRYQDNSIMDETKRAIRKNRCFRYSHIGAIFFTLVATLALGSILIIDQAEMRSIHESNKNNNNNDNDMPVGKIDTPSIDSGDFYELQDNKKPSVVGDDDDDDSEPQSAALDPDQNKGSKQQNSSSSSSSSSLLPCTDNPKFLHNGEYGKNCEWVSMMDTVARCTRKGVTENCQQTCDPFCSTPTTFPTEYPTYFTYAPTISSTQITAELKAHSDENEMGFR